MSKLSPTTLLLAFLLAFLGGVALGRFFAVDWLLAAGLGAVTLGAALLLRRVPSARLALLIVAGVLFGLARFTGNTFEATEVDLSFWNDRDERVAIVGIVAEAPDWRMDHTKYTIEASTLDGREIQGRVLVKAARFPAYDYGDELRLTGKLQTPFESEEFSYRDYLARYGVYSVIYYPQIERLTAHNGNAFFASLFELRELFEGKINQIFHEPEASFMAGLLTGSRRGIPADVMDDFNTTGLTHIIAISGYNIALVIVFAVAVIGRLVARRWQFPLVAVFVILFTLFVGAGPSVVRAAIMGLLAFYALTAGRQYHVGIAVTVTAAVMVAWNPAILLTDVSFQLSFAAVLGLLFVAPHLEGILKWAPQKFAIRESLTMTIAAQITAVPLIVFYFDRLSLVSPLANVLVAPAIPLAMLAGLAATLIGWIWLPVGVVLAAIPYLFLNYILKIADVLAAVPGADVAVTQFGQGAVIVYYVVLVGWLLWLHAREKNRAAQENVLTQNPLAAHAVTREKN